MGSKIEFGTRSLVSNAECEILQYLYTKKTPQRANEIMAYIVDMYRNEKHNMPSPGTISATMTRMQRRGLIKKLQLDRQVAYSPASTKSELLVDIAYEIGVSMGLLQRDEMAIMKQVKSAMASVSKKMATVEPKDDPTHCPFPLEGED